MQAHKLLFPYSLVFLGTELGAKKSWSIKVKLLARNTFAWKLFACVTLHLEELWWSNPSTYKHLNSSQRWATRIGEKHRLGQWVKVSLVHSALGRSTLLNAWRDSGQRGARAVISPLTWGYDPHTPICFQMWREWEKVRSNTLSPMADSVPKGWEGWRVGDAGRAPKDCRFEEEALFALCRLSLEPRCDFLHHGMGTKSLASSDTTYVINPGTGHGRKKHSQHSHHGRVMILWFNFPNQAGQENVLCCIISSQR